MIARFGRKEKGSRLDPFRFEGDGVTFKGKLIGIEEVNMARGDKMCQETMHRLKAVVKVAGVHKQRILISVSLQGIQIKDESTQKVMFKHPVHRISFISQDVTEARAFGFISGSPQGGHKFTAIKTEKAASQVVIALRDLFQVVLEMKQCELQKARNGQGSFSSSNSQSQAADAANFAALNGCNVVALPPSPESPPANPPEPAVADLLDLQSEMDILQQGIQQMESTITTAEEQFGDRDYSLNSPSVSSMLGTPGHSSAILSTDDVSNSPSAFPLFSSASTTHHSTSSSNANLTVLLPPPASHNRSATRAATLSTSSLQNATKRPSSASDANRGVTNQLSLDSSFQQRPSSANVSSAVPTNSLHAQTKSDVLSLFDSTPSPNKRDDVFFGSNSSVSTTGGFNANFGAPLTIPPFLPPKESFSKPDTTDGGLSSVNFANGANVQWNSAATSTNLQQVKTNAHNVSQPNAMNMFSANSATSAFQPVFQQSFNSPNPNFKQNAAGWSDFSAPGSTTSTGAGFGVSQQHQQKPQNQSAFGDFSLFNQATSNTGFSHNNSQPVGSSVGFDGSLFNVLSSGADGANKNAMFSGAAQASIAENTQSANYNTLPHNTKSSVFSSGTAETRTAADSSVFGYDLSSKNSPFDFSSFSQTLPKNTSVFSSASFSNPQNSNTVSSVSNVPTSVDNSIFGDKSSGNSFMADQVDGFDPFVVPASFQSIVSSKSESISSNNFGVSAGSAQSNSTKPTASYSAFEDLFQMPAASQSKASASFDQPQLGSNASSMFTNVNNSQMGQHPASAGKVSSAATANLYSSMSTASSNSISQAVSSAAPALPPPFSKPAVQVGSNTVVSSVSANPMIQKNLLNNNPPSTLTISHSTSSSSFSTPPEDPFATPPSMASPQKSVSSNSEAYNDADTASFSMDKQYKDSNDFFQDLKLPKSSSLTGIDNSTATSNFVSALSTPQGSIEASLATDLSSSENDLTSSSSSTTTSVPPPPSFAPPALPSAFSPPPLPLDPSPSVSVGSPFLSNPSSLTVTETTASFGSAFNDLEVSAINNSLPGGPSSFTLSTASSSTISSGGTIKRAPSTNPFLDDPFVVNSSGVSGNDAFTNADPFLTTAMQQLDQHQPPRTNNNSSIGAADSDPFKAFSSGATAISQSSLHSSVSSHNDSGGSFLSSRSEDSPAVSAESTSSGAFAAPSETHDKNNFFGDNNYKMATASNFGDFGVNFSQGGGGGDPFGNSASGKQDSGFFGARSDQGQNRAGIFRKKEDPFGDSFFTESENSTSDFSDSSFANSGAAAAASSGFPNADPWGMSSNSGNSNNNVKNNSGSDMKNNWFGGNQVGSFQ